MASVQVETVPAIIRRRRRSSVEIIDIDELDDDEIRASQRQFRQRRTQNVRRRSVLSTSTDDVIVIESDDDELAPVEFSRRPTTGRYLSPPPPPLTGGRIPPVPPVPPRYAPLQFLPHRARPPNYAAGVVHPIQLPFNFETNQSHDSPRFFGQRNDPVAAPPSHHLPSMGLGGALITENRRLEQEELAAHTRRRQDVVENSETRQAYRILDYRRLSHRAEALAWLQDEANLLFEPPSLTADLRTQLNANSGYTPSFTHPGKVPTGYTFDFAPLSSQDVTPSSVESGPEASSSKVTQEETSTLLICGQCLDPLVLGDGDQKLWGLRCGHLLDGKCVEKLMIPPPVAENSTTKDNGKPPDGQLSTDVNGANEDTSLDGIPYRNRLRSRATPRPQPLPRFSRGGWQKNIKGKAKAEEPLEEKSHEWTCPIAGCGRIHRSLFVGGKWVADNEKGAIGIFA